jgi:formylglycine-generating enzyme required for sulfatase activity
MFISDYGKAIADFNEMIKRNPDDKDVYYFRGRANLYNGDYNSANADFSVMLRKNPNFYFGDGILDLLSSCTIGLAARQNTKMVRIEGGSFMMGSPNSEPLRDNNEGPQHQVKISTFYMSKFQVTQKEYQEIMGKNPSRCEGINNPVENITWYDAIEYCNALSRREGLTPAYTIDKTKFDPNYESPRGPQPSILRDRDPVMWVVTWNRNANGYRLPTEAEWEYACRAGTTTPFSTGNNITTSQANYHGNYPYNNNTKGMVRESTTGVGSFSFAPNPWGLYDMHGNVWEWCWDWFGTYPNSVETNPVGPISGSFRVARGGSFYNPAVLLRSANRLHHAAPFDTNPTMGFRIVRSGN